MYNPVIIHEVLAEKENGWCSRTGLEGSIFHDVAGSLRHETDQVACERIEDACIVGVCAVHQNEETVRGGSDNVIVAEHPEFLAQGSAGGGVDQEARGGAARGSVDVDPVTRVEARVGGIVGVLGGGAPAMADGAEVHVVVDVAGGQEAVGDAVDEVGRERGPVCGKLHGCTYARRNGGSLADLV